MTREGFSIGGVALAATAMLVPWSSLLMVAFGVGSACVAVGLVREFGQHAIGTDPTRCPACKRDDLMRIETSMTRERIPLLHCRSCGEAFRSWGNTLVRDTGGCQLP